MITDQEIADARAAEKAAHDAYVNARDLCCEREIQRACERYSVKRDDVVVDKKGRKGVVCKVKPWSDSKPWVTAREIKKDGALGMRELQMYSDWTVLAE